MNIEPLTRVSDAEMDMNRAVARGSKMSGMFAAALSWLTPTSTTSSMTWAVKAEVFDHTVVVELWQQINDVIYPLPIRIN